MKKISLNFLARELNLSKTTVSMVLNGRGDHHKINADTQRRVMEVARKHNYRPNQIARNLSKGNSMTLGLIVPNISDSYFSSSAYHFEDLAREFNYKVLLGSSREDEKREIELLRTFDDQQVDGILIASTRHNLPTIQKMYDGGLPIVLFDRNYEETLLPTVHVDSYGGLKMLVQQIKESGKSKIGYIGVDLDLTPLHDRRKGFKDGIDEDAEICSFQKIIDYDDYRVACVQAIDSLIDTEQCESIIFETQYLTITGIKHLVERKEKGLKIVSLSSFGDHEVFNIFKPKITAIDFQIEKIIKSAFDMLFGIIENKEPVKKENLTKVVLPKLIVRH